MHGCGGRNEDQNKETNERKTNKSVYRPILGEDLVKPRYRCKKDDRIH